MAGQDEYVVPALPEKYPAVMVPKEQNCLVNTTVHGLEASDNHQCEQTFFVAEMD